VDIGPSYYPERALMYSERRGGFWQALGACVKASNPPPHACIYDANKRKERNNLDSHVAAVFSAELIRTLRCHCEVRYLAAPKKSPATAAR
jgi:hypothetical protein